MPSPRPKLTLETAPEYLDWIAEHAGGSLTADSIKHHLTLAELLVRLRMGEAQDKATQHTLVEDGVIEQPGQ